MQSLGHRIAASQDPIHVKRRTKLARALRTKKVKKHFNWGYWLNMDIRIRGKFLVPYQERLKEAIDRLTGKLKPLKNCGTTACVAGWCPIIFPEHWSYGVVRAPQSRLVGQESRVSLLSVRPVLKEGYPTLLSDKTTLWCSDHSATDSFEDFFGVTRAQAHSICGTGTWVIRGVRKPTGEDQPEQLADAIESLNK